MLTSLVEVCPASIPSLDTRAGLEAVLRLGLTADKRWVKRIQDALVRHIRRSGTRVTLGADYEVYVIGAARYIIFAQHPLSALFAAVLPYCLGQDPYRAAMAFLAANALPKGRYGLHRAN